MKASAKSKYLTGASDTSVPASSTKPLMPNRQSQPFNSRTGSFIGKGKKEPSVQDMESDASSSVMVREMSAFNSRMSSRMGSVSEAPVRVVDNTRLSALTN